MEKNLDKIVNLCKTRGLIFPGSEIYDGFANTWDYGPVGVLLKNNLKNFWWTKMVQRRPNSFGIDASILMNPKVWEASGHAKSFADPKVDCKNCKNRQRADHLIENFDKTHTVIPDTMTNEEMDKYIQDNHIKCPVCGKFDWTPVRQFKLMFETSRGTVEGEKDVVYLRPETCQGEYVNFLNVQRTMRAKIPFGIAQIGKSFRNEITPGNFIFRCVEFEQMEYQWFCHPDDSAKYYEEFKRVAYDFATSCGIKEENLRFHDHDKLAFYAKAACDLQVNFPIGWQELNGVHNRSDYDLTQHSKFSGKTLDYLDPFTNERYTPYIIEYSMSPERLMLAVMCEAYDEEKLADGETRVVMHLKPQIAPYKVAILPLQKNLSEKATEIYSTLSSYFMCSYDEAGSIGKRYRRQDEIGTPFCVTIDFDTLNDNTVTIRDRDSMQQIRIKVDELKDYIEDRVKM